MNLISHRGNLNGPSNSENKIQSIIECIDMGYDVEVDVWKIGNDLFLGHDNPNEKIGIQFLIDHCDYLLVHAKNPSALEEVLRYKEIESFYHLKDDYAFTSKGTVIVMPRHIPIVNSIYMMPEFGNYTCIQNTCSGICSDYIEKYKEVL